MKEASLAPTVRCSGSVLDKLGPKGKPSCCIIPFLTSAHYQPNPAPKPSFEISLHGLGPQPRNHGEGTGGVDLIAAEYAIWADHSCL